MSVICPYCEREAMRTTGAELHPARADLALKRYYHCRNCDATVACAPGSWDPVGSMANAELRRARQNVHAALDKIWKPAMTRLDWTMTTARSAAYTWLYEELGLPYGRRSIASFDRRLCDISLAICEYREPVLIAAAAHRTQATRSRRAAR